MQEIRLLLWLGDILGPVIATLILSRLIMFILSKWNGGAVRLIIAHLVSLVLAGALGAVAAAEWVEPAFGHALLQHLAPQIAWLVFDLVRHGLREGGAGNGQAQEDLPPEVLAGLRERPQSASATSASGGAVGAPDASGATDTADRTQATGSRRLRSWDVAFRIWIVWAVLAGLGVIGNAAIRGTPLRAPCASFEASTSPELKRRYREDVRTGEVFVVDERNQLIPIEAHLARAQDDLQTAQALGHDNGVRILSAAIREARMMTGMCPSKALVEQGRAGLSFLALYVLLPLVGLFAAGWARRRPVRGGGAHQGGA